MTSTYRSAHRQIVYVYVYVVHDLYSALLPDTSFFVVSVPRVTWRTRLCTCHFADGLRENGPTLFKENNFG